MKIMEFLAISIVIYFVCISPRNIQYTAAASILVVVVIALALGGNKKNE